MQSNNKRRSWDRSDGRGKSRKRPKAKRNLRAPNGRVAIYSAAGQQLLRDINSLRRFINTELHFVDATASTTSSTTPALVLLNGLSLGDTASTRTGQSIKMDRGDFRFQLAVNATSVINFTRIIVVLDKQTNATAMTAADLLVANTPYSPYTFGSQSRFVILYDETFALSTYSAGAITKCVGLPGINQHVIFNSGNAGSVADIVSNSVYLIHLSDQATNTPAFSYYSRIWFVDN